MVLVFFAPGRLEPETFQELLLFKRADLKKNITAL